MTVSNAKPGGATPKKAAQTSVKKNVAGVEKTPKRASDAQKEENKGPDKAAETPVAAETERPLETDARAAREDDPAEQAAQDDELNAKYMRLAADFQNYKRRVEKEKSDVYAYANEKIAVDLLGVLDNFERALESQSGQEAPDEGFAKGMELICKQLSDILVKNGVEEIPSLGEDFDPSLHHAVMMEETEAYESGKVSAVLGKGYKLRDRVIRPTTVKVSQ
jgi:molecular chaperone GrpE